jgi:hypothetical protein
MKRRIQSTDDSSAQGHLFEAQHFSARVKETGLWIGTKRLKGRAVPEEAEEHAWNRPKLLVTFAETSVKFSPANPLGPRPKLAGQIHVMRKRPVKVAIAVGVLAAAGFGGYAAYVKLIRPPAAASCANCRSFIYLQLEQYAIQHDGWYPKGGRDRLDSLAKCVGQVKDVRFFTSHAQSRRLAAYWQEHQTFSSNLCCYRYVEGLRTNDPQGLVMLYYWKPTRWECSSHKMQEEGRSVCFSPPGHSWEFIQEEQFQKRLAHTLAYLREQARAVAE